MIAKIDQLLLQNVLHEFQFHLDVCRATNGALTELSYGMKEYFLSYSLQMCELNFSVGVISLPIHLYNCSYNL
jgi:hypothetical protein